MDSRWKDIDSAPRDGTWILGVQKGFVPAVVQWSREYGNWSEFDDEDHDADREGEKDWFLTHWMELPAYERT